MMFINYDLAKAITEDRRARALARFNRREHSRLPRPVVDEAPAVGADIVELQFGMYCETDRIGA